MFSAIEGIHRVVAAIEIVEVKVRIRIVFPASNRDAFNGMIINLTGSKQRTCDTGKVGL